VSVSRSPGAALLAVAAMAATAGLSQVPYLRSGAGEALLRLSWRAVSERVDECRQATEEELSRLPLHMRQETVCEGRVAPFHLRVDVDGDVVIDEEVRASGAREDRPVYILREHELRPGTHNIRVRFERVGADAATGEQQAGATGGAPAGARFPAALDWSESLSVAPGEVALITWDAATRSLVRRASQPR